MMRALLLEAFLLLFLGATIVPLVHAQGTWAGECTAAKKCAAVADPPAPQAGVTLTTCTLNGLPGGAVVKPIVAKASLPAPLNTNATIKDPTCFWPDLVLSPGIYTLTATVQDAGGRSSAATDPPIVATVLTPLGPPGGLRLFAQ